MHAYLLQFVSEENRGHVFVASCTGIHFEVIEWQVETLIAAAFEVGKFRGKTRRHAELEDL